MLETVHALRFVAVLDGGRNCPWLIEAERASGEVVEVAAKLGTAECGFGGLVREAFSSMLAADLDLPAPEPFVVLFPQEFVDTLPNPELRHRLSSLATGFGCRFVQGMLNVDHRLQLSRGLLEQAASAFFFDSAILNSDRTPNKPNCLTNGTSLLLIDHELSLHLHGRGSLVEDPWRPGAVAAMNNGPFPHLFFSPLKGGVHNFDSVLLRLAAIGRERISAYRNAIPPDWDSEDIAEGIEAFLADLVEHSADLLIEVQGALS